MNKKLTPELATSIAADPIIIFYLKTIESNSERNERPVYNDNTLRSSIFFVGGHEKTIVKSFGKLIHLYRRLLLYYYSDKHDEDIDLVMECFTPAEIQECFNTMDETIEFWHCLLGSLIKPLLLKELFLEIMIEWAKRCCYYRNGQLNSQAKTLYMDRLSEFLRLSTKNYTFARMELKKLLSLMDFSTYTDRYEGMTVKFFNIENIILDIKDRLNPLVRKFVLVDSAYGIYNIATEKKPKTFSNTISPTNKITPNMLSTKSTTNREPCSKFVVIRKFYKPDESTTTKTSAYICARKRRYDPYKYSPTALDANRRTVKTYQMKNKVKNYQYGNYDKVKHAMDPVTLSEREAASSIQFSDVDDLADDDTEVGLLTISGITNELIKTDSEIEESEAVKNVQVRNDVCTASFKDIVTQPALRIDPDRTIKTYQRKNKVKNYQYGNYDKVKHAINKVKDTEIMPDNSNTITEITITDKLLDLCMLPETTHDETKSPILVDKSASIFGTVEDDGVEMDPATLKEIQNEREAAASIQFNDVDGLANDDRELDLFTISGSTIELIKTDSETEESDAVENVRKVRNDVGTATLKDFVTQTPQRINPEREHESVVVVKSESHGYQHPQRDCADLHYPESGKIISVNNIRETYKVGSDDKDIYLKDEEKVAELRNIPATLENASTTSYEVPVFTIIPLSSISSNGAAIEFLVKIEDPEFEPQIKTEQQVDNEKIKTKSPILVDKNAAVFGTVENNDVEMDPATLKEIENERDAASSIQFNDVDGLADNDRELDLFTISESTNDKQMISPAGFDEIDALFGSENDDNIEMFELIETDSESEESDAVANVQFLNDVCTATLKDIVNQPPTKIGPGREHESVVVVKSEPHDYQHTQRDCTVFPYPESGKIISVNNICETYKVEADDKDIYMNDGEKVAELRNIPATLENASATPYEVPVFTIIPLSSISSNGAAIEFLVKIENPEFEPQIKIQQQVDNEKIKTKSPILVDKNAAIFGTVENNDVEMDPATLKEIENERDAASSIQFNDVDGLADNDRELDLFTISESTNDKQMISPAEIDALFGSENDDNIEMFELIETDSELEESDAVENVQVRNDVCTATLKDIVNQPPTKIGPAREHESVVVVKSEPHDYQHTQRDCTDFPYPESGKIISVNNICETYKVEADDKDIYMNDGEKVAELRNIAATLENASTTPYEVPVFTIIPLSSISSKGAAVEFLVKIENPEFEPQIKTEQETEPKSSLCETSLREEITITNAQDAIEYLKKLKRFVHRTEDRSAVMLMELLEHSLEE